MQPFPGRARQHMGLQKADKACEQSVLLFFYETDNLLRAAGYPFRKKIITHFARRPCPLFANPYVALPYPEMAAYGLPGLWHAAQLYSTVAGEFQGKHCAISCFNSCNGAYSFYSTAPEIWL